MANINNAAFQKLIQDRVEAELGADPKCTKILPATSAAPKYKFVMPTEFVMKHMSHLIEKQLQLVDDNDRQFTITLIQRRNKDKFEYMLSGWRKYGDVNQIKEGDTVLFEMLNPGMLKVSVISHGNVVPRAPKVPKRKRQVTDTDDDDDYEGGGQDLPPGYAQHTTAAAVAAQQQQQQQQQGGGGLPPLGDASSLAALAGSQRGGGGGNGGPQPSQSGGGVVRSASPHQTVSPFEMVGRAGLPGFGPLDPPLGAGRGGSGGVGGGGGGIGSAASPLAPLLNLPQRQQTTPADQLAAALTAVQQLELPPNELMALIHGTSTAASLSDLAPLQSADLIALLQQQQLMAGGGGNGGPGGGGDKGPGLPSSMSPLMPGLAAMQPTVAELAAVVNQLEKQARGESALQQPDTAPAWEVLLQENVQLREDLQQWKGKLNTLQGVVHGVGRAIHQKTDPGLVAMTGVFNAMNQIEAPEFLREMPERSRTQVHEVLQELRQQLNLVLQMVWEVRQLSDQLGRELAASEDMAPRAPGVPPPRMPNGH